MKLQPDARGLLIIGTMVLLLISGCATVVTQGKLAEEYVCDDCSNVPQIYSGTVVNVCALRPENLAILVTIVDLPLSFIADTLILPYTIYRQYSEGWICSEGKLQNENP